MRDAIVDSCAPLWPVVLFSLVVIGVPLLYIALFVACIAS